MHSLPHQGSTGWPGGNTLIASLLSEVPSLRTAAAAPGRVQGSKKTQSACAVTWHQSPANQWGKQSFLPFRQRELLAFSLLCIMGAGSWQ